MCNIYIVKADRTNIDQVNNMDNRFIVDSKAVLKMEEDQIQYRLERIAAFIKKYPNEERPIDYTDYVDNPDKAIYLAYSEDKAIGQIIIRSHWNKYAIIEDVRVDISYRKQGIGRRLVGHAKEWGKQKGLAGLTLETQNNNIRACKFYESCGFHIGGFDQKIYKGMGDAASEVALYYYFLFD
ncbi:MAG TPA: GNAT family N-acetyltransferase [Bacillota bacterium]|nr:GNAT family N-acetyltransferase [Bacillota bacterium]